MQEAATTHSTDHPRWQAILVAEQINRRNGGALVAPWELEQLPDEWLDAYQVLARGAAAQQQKSRLEHLFVAFRQKHPTYRKYLS